MNWPVHDMRLDDHTPPGLAVFWRICRRMKEVGALDRAGLMSALKRAIEVATPRNLRLADEVLRLFVSEGHNKQHELIDDAGRQDLLARCQELLCRFSGDPDRLVAALKNSYRLTLFSITWGHDRVQDKEHRAGLPFADWPALSVTVLDAARRAPSVMLPQITSFLVSYADSFEATEGGLVQRWVFETDAANRLFGIDPLREVFACRDGSLHAMSPDRAKEARYVRDQLSAAITTLQSDSAGRA